MVTGLLALLIAMIAWRFGYQALEGGNKLLARIGLWFVMAGTAVMTKSPPQAPEFIYGVRRACIRFVVVV